MPDRPLPTMLAVLEDVCAEAGYDFRCLDGYSKQLVRIACGGRFFLTGTGRINAYPLNNGPAASVARDKVFTYQTLEQAGLRVPPYEYFFLHGAYRAVRGDGREREDITAGAARIGFPLFVKPLDGSRGNLAEIVRTPQELEHQVNHIAAVHHGLLLQPVLTGAEYRLFMIDDTALFLYRRRPAYFKGDGERTIASFLSEENAHRVSQGLTPITIESPFLQNALKQNGLGLDTRLAKDAVFHYLPTANISAGGQISDFTVDIPTPLAQWGYAVNQALSLRVGAIDFFAPDGLSALNTLDLIEVNSNPSVAGLLQAGHKETVARIWQIVCERYFDGGMGKA